MTDRTIQRWAIAYLIVFVLLGTYAALAAMGVVPAAPWSPLGQR